MTTAWALWGWLPNTKRWYEVGISRDKGQITRLRKRWVGAGLTQKLVIKRLKVPRAVLRGSKLDPYENGRGTYVR